MKQVLGKALPDGSFFGKEAQKHTQKADKLREKIGRNSFSKKKPKKQEKLRSGLAKEEKEGSLNNMISKALNASNTLSGKAGGDANKTKEFSNELPQIIVTPEDDKPKA